MSKHLPHTHTVPSDYVRPNHPIPVTLIGCGGTGSHLLTRLTAINYALVNTNHPGIFVTAYDPDHFTEWNVGRQSCYPSDVGLNKAQVLVARVNRTYGLTWQGVADYWPGKATSKIVITCVDNVKARARVKDLANKNCYFDYWLDCGNDQHTGQIILGTGKKIKQPEGLGQTVGRLPHIFDLYPDLKSFEKPEDPSCSMAEALGRQDLCMNAMIATWAQKILWSMLHDYRIEYHGVFVNLKSMTTAPVPVRPFRFKRK